MNKRTGTGSQKRMKERANKNNELREFWSFQFEAPSKLSVIGRCAYRGVLQALSQEKFDFLSEFFLLLVDCFCRLRSIVGSHALALAAKHHSVPVSQDNMHCNSALICLKNLSYYESKESDT